MKTTQSALQTGRHDRAVGVNLWDYTISFISRIDRIMEHYHHCYKVTITLDNTFDCEIDGQQFSGIRGFIVNQSVTHACFAPGANVLVNFIEADSFWGWQIKSLLGDRPFLNINEVMEEDAIGTVLPANYNELSDELLVPYVNDFLNSLFVAEPSINCNVVDERIGQALKYIDENLNLHIELEDIGSILELSPGRLRHLFAEQMGIPFSQYILWKRMRNTLRAAILDEDTLTQACHRFGFADQPHFNRSFRRFFGMKPRLLINYSRILL